MMHNNKFNTNNAIKNKHSFTKRPYIPNQLNGTIFTDLIDYVLDCNNMNARLKYYNERIAKPVKPLPVAKPVKPLPVAKPVKHLPVAKPVVHKKLETVYKPKQKDSFFWCFYIMKHGYFKYEMELNNRHFVVENEEKYAYVEKLRLIKTKLKMHKIAPFTEIESDITSQHISLKTFFAICVLEGVNALVVDGRKYYEIILDDANPVHIVHRNSDTSEHWIELDNSPQNIAKTRSNYYKIDGFGASSLKSMSSYKMSELEELCRKLNIDIDSIRSENGKKRTKKDVYLKLTQVY